MEKLIAFLNFIYYRWFLKATGFFYILAFPTIKGAKKIKIGRKFYANRFLRIEVIGSDSEVKLFIGNNVSIGEHVHFAVLNKVIIGNDVLMGSRIIITDHNHGIYGGPNLSDPEVPPQERELFSDGPVIIEEKVWIGDGAVILPNVTIGKCSVIGANSVVTRSIPAYSICGGIPAVVLKKYNLDRKCWEKISTS